MIEATFQALLLVLQWPTVGYLVLGVLLGLFFGAVPGLSGLIGMVILLPFTFDLAPETAFALLLGLFSVTTTSDTIASVLLGVPGTAGSQATILDGYAMAQKGEAARAFGAAFTVSALGGVLGAILLGVSLPFIRPLIFAFGMPEYFMLGVLGLSLVGSLSGDSILKGLAAGCLGVLISTIGYSPQEGMPRYAFGILYLLDEGLPLIPTVLGLFGLPELILLATRKTSVSQVQRRQIATGILTGVRDAFENWWLALRCSAIGMYIGILPGLGATIVDWVAYGHAVQSCKDSSGFGKGDVRGVIAPESANNAMKGAALIPTVAFGIPGSASMAILLAAFLIHGLTPGPSMLTIHLPITLTLMWILIISNILAALLLMIWSRHVAKIAFVEGRLVFPTVVVFLLMGAWTAGGRMGDWYLLIVFGTLGLVMRAGGWQRAPLVLGFILGSIMEKALDVSMQSYGWQWIYRPISLAVGLLALLTIVLSATAYRRRRFPLSFQADPRETSTERNDETLPSFLLAVVCLTLLVIAVTMAWDWPREASLFPISFGISGIVFLLAIIFFDLKSFRRVTVTKSQPFATQCIEAIRSPDLRGVLVMYVWLFGIIVGTYFFGQLIALPLFILCYLKLSAKKSWGLSFAYASLGWLFLYAFFDQIIHVLWYEPPFL